MAVIHVDADSLLYKAGFSVEKNGVLVNTAVDKVFFNLRDLITKIANSGQDYAKQIEQEIQFQFYIGKPHGNNFRSKVAVTLPYKKRWNAATQQFESRKRPILFEAANELLVHVLKYVVRLPTDSLLYTVNNVEAEDLIVDRYDPMNDVIYHIDKDLNQCAGLHFNYDKGFYYTVTDEEAEWNLWRQIVLGDSVDNIPGLKYFCSFVSKNKKKLGFGPSGFSAAFKDSTDLESDVKEWVRVNRKEEYLNERFGDWYDQILSEQKRLILLGGVYEQAEITVTNLQ